MTQTSTYIPGLAGVIAAQTRLSRVDGERGELVIAGFPLETLVRNASYEEAVYALWFDRLPNASELAEFKAQLADARALPDAIVDILRAAAARGLAPMDALGMGAEALKLVVPFGGDLQQTWFEQAVPLLANMPVILAAYWRLLNGEEPVEPERGVAQVPGNRAALALDHAGNFLYMLTGELPSEAQRRAVSTYMTTVSDHGLNVSTFTARTIISTDSDLVSAVARSRVWANAGLAKAIDTAPINRLFHMACLVSSKGIDQRTLWLICQFSSRGVKSLLKLP